MIVTTDGRAGGGGGGGGGGIKKKKGAGSNVRGAGTCSGVFRLKLSPAHNTNYGSAPFMYQNTGSRLN